jgi:phage shock protein A
MDSDFEEINRLKNSFRTLTALYERIKSENGRLYKENEEFRKNKEIMEYEISELTQQYETLKLAKTITSSSKDAHEAKIKINRMVRDIDECIGILNK